MMCLDGSSISSINQTIKTNVNDFIVSEINLFGVVGVGDWCILSDLLFDF